MFKIDFTTFSRRAIRFVLVFVICIFSSQCFSQSSIYDDKISNFQYLRNLNSIFDFVQQNYVDEVDPKILYEGAMKGMMNALGDPYTSYLDKSTIRDLNDTTKGKFGGVGLMISKPYESTSEKPAYVEVSTPIEDSPGARAGIIAGDLIIEVEGRPTPEMTMEEVLDVLRGEIGEEVHIKIRRGKNFEFDVTLVRALIEVPTVKFSMIEKIGYIRLTQFTPDTAIRMQEALNMFEKSNYESLILDLRDNPGGLITSAVEIADKFIDEGPIVSTKSRLAFENSVYPANSAKTVVRNKPIVVLINNGSASASEIVSGALKDNHLAYLIGVRTYGKGSVQNVVPFGNNEEIKMTIARYYTPSDTNIDKIGIPPDLEVKFPQLTKENEEAYINLMKENVIDSYVDSNPNMTESDIANYAKELKKTYDIDEKLLRRLVRMRVERTKNDRIFDLDYDVQLNKAIEILNVHGKNFKKLLSSTKTLKELQKEAEEQKEQEENEEQKD